MLVSIIVPVYNEAEGLPTLMSRLRLAAQRMDAELRSDFRQ